MKSNVTLILFLSFGVYITNGVPIGSATFNNTVSGVLGQVVLHTNPVLGTYLIGQLRNISCFNETSATKNQLLGPQINTCVLGLTINNWRNTTAQQQYVTPELEAEWRQRIFNLTNNRLPNIQQILSGNYNPFQNLFPNVKPKPVSGVFGQIRDNANNSCANVGSVYNPRQIAGPLGIASPSGLLGNLMVNNGAGSLLMGPLELLTAGPMSIMGLPLTLWMDAIRPVINGTAITMSFPKPERILECSVIRPNNVSMFSLI